MPVRLFTWAVCVFIASAAVAQTTEPVTIPGVHVDQSTPHGAIDTWMIASTLNDAPTMRSALYGDDDTQRRLIYALSALAEARNALEAAKKAAFPTEYKDPLPQQEAMLAEVVAQIGVGKEQIDGDTAEYQRDQRGHPIILKKYDGQWCVPVTSIFTPHDPVALAFATRQVIAEAAVDKQGAADIAAGKYVSLTEADDTIQHHIDEAKARATTQP